MEVTLRIREHQRRRQLTLYGPTVMAVKRAFFLVVEASARTTDTYVCMYVRTYVIGGLSPVGLVACTQ